MEDLCKGRPVGLPVVWWDLGYWEQAVVVIALEGFVAEDDTCCGERLVADFVDEGTQSFSRQAPCFGQLLEQGIDRDGARWFESECCSVAAPVPVLGGGAEARADGVADDVAHGAEKVLVTLDEDRADRPWVRWPTRLWRRLNCCA